MSRRGSNDGQLFVGRLSKSTRVRDLEDIFEPYGRMVRCEVKYGAEMAYAFVDYEDRRDAEDAVKYENGREICGSSIIVEWAKGNPRRPLVNRGQSYDECYRCHKSGHWARDCPDDKGYGGRRPSSDRGGGRSGRYRSPDRGSRRRSRSRSRDRRRRSRSRSRSRDQKKERRSRSRERKDSKSKSKPSRSRSKSPSKSPSRSRSKSRSGSAEPVNGGDQKSDRSRSRSRSASAD